MTDAPLTAPEAATQRAAKTYLVKSIFATVQGEGFHAGTPAVFVRLAGCNLWSGRAKDRDRDADRHGAACPRWCDTDFTKEGAEHLTAREISERVRNAGPDYPLVVVTGGEPLLQLDAALVKELYHYTSAHVVAVETNGTVPLDDDLLGLAGEELFVTCSPKVCPQALRLQHADEVKVVLPDYSSYALAAAAWLALDTYRGLRGRFVQPRDPAVFAGEGVDSFDTQAYRAAAAACLDFVTENPTWRISTQTHKLNGYP